jgi:hypothetical protein
MSEQSPPVMSNDEFAEAMRPMGTALSEWASVWSRQPAAFGYIPTADSRAMEELAAEHRWATPAWLEPARNAHSFGHMLSYALMGWQPLPDMAAAAEEFRAHSSKLMGTGR